ncbi:MAG: tetratricopeptide repeat protein, partial [Anaerolineae bacterium]|nr:tetratricopeptide repeat protein [Anaerolineae bacterium]
AESLIKTLSSRSDKEARSFVSAGLAHMLAFQGKFEQALALLDQGIAADRSEGIEGWPKANKHLTKFFIYKAKIEDWDLALQEIEIIREIQGKLDLEDPVRLRDWYAIILALLGQISKADEALWTWRQDIDENDPIQMSRYHRFFGIVELIKGHPKTAITYLKKGLSENSMPIFVARYGLALAYVESGQMAEAVNVLEKAVLSYDDRRMRCPIWSVKTHYFLGLGYEELGRNKEAIGQYEEFLDIWKDADPGIPEVEGAKKRLGKLTVDSLQ